MKQYPVQPLVLRILAAAAAAALFTVNVQAHPDLHVAVHPTYYVLAGRVFEQPDSLAAAIGTMRPRTVGVDACGAGTTRALMAAAHSLRAHPLRLRIQDKDDAACASTAVLRQTVGERAQRIDDAAVKRYWDNIAP